MSVFSGANVIKDSIILDFDAANPKSNRGRRSILTWNTWTAGSGSVTGYTQNGLTSENVRSLQTDPFGNQSIVWGGLASGDGNADGGWETPHYPIDNSKLYRQSVWWRRKSTTASGTAYLGLRTNGTGSIILNSNGTTQTNPYWHTPSIASLPQNQWQLVVAHIFPASYTGTTGHPDSGIYLAGSTTKIGSHTGNIGNQDCRFPTNATTIMNRTYQYYSADTTTELEFYEPRIDLCDGTEPTISELVDNIGDRVSSNLSNYVFDMSRLKTSLIGEQKYLSFDGTASTDMRTTTPFTLNSNVTIEVLVRATAAGGTFNMILGKNLPYLSFMNGDRIYASTNIGGTQRSFQTANTLLLNTWYFVTYTTSFTTTNTTSKIYINGVESASDTQVGKYAASASTFFIGGWDIGGSYPFFGDIAKVTVYDRSLTQDEILQNFNAIRGRYGI